MYRVSTISLGCVDRLRSGQVLVGRWGIMLREVANIPSGNSMEYCQVAVAEWGQKHVNSKQTHKALLTRREVFKSPESVDSQMHWVLGTTTIMAIPDRRGLERH